MDMTISQALRKISKLKGEAKEQFARASNSVFFNIDNPPAFAFSSSLELADKTVAEIVKFETALRITNASTKIEWQGRKLTLSEATCILQQAKGKIAWLKTLNCQAQEERVEESKQRDVYEQTWTTKKNVFKCALTEAKRAEWVKREQDQFDALNDAVETANHRTSLVWG